LLLICGLQRRINIHRLNISQKRVENTAENRHEKAATCAAYWLHLHCVITVNIRGVVAPQVLL